MMNQDSLLIFIYLTVCHYFKQHVDKKELRKTPHFNPVFTDEEVLTIYIFGTLSGMRNNKKTHQFIYCYWEKWFPKLPKYCTYNHRLNFLMETFVHFCDAFIQTFQKETHNNENIVLIDSMPVFLSKGTRALNAKVAKETASFGYCSSKKTYYWGIKFHLFANYIEGTLPLPRLLNITGANEHDLPAVKRLFYEFKGSKIIGDKAYLDLELKQDLLLENIELYTPCKLTKIKKELTEEENLFSKILNSVRQSIEIFFNWIIETTGIQNASKVRSEEGLGVHIFGRFAAAMIALALR